VASNTASSSPSLFSIFFISSSSGRWRWRRFELRRPLDIAAAKNSSFRRLLRHLLFSDQTSYIISSSVRRCQLAPLPATTLLRRACLRSTATAIDRVQELHREEPTPATAATGDGEPHGDGVLTRRLRRGGRWQADGGRARTRAAE
jgi:hypothetical protein